MKYKLNSEELDLLKSIENDEWQSVDNNLEENKRYRDAARNTFKKTKRINLRLSVFDFNKAQTKSLEEGIPYQTLLSSVIHKYLTGRLVEKKSAK